jgi:ArsR family transcriptional regulator
MTTESNSQPLTCLDVDETEPQQLTDSEAVDVARALGHPTRMQIVEFFRDRCPRNVGDVVAELPLAQSTVSTHLRILREAGVIRTIRTDSRAWMCMNRSVLRGFANYVNLVTERSPVTVARSGPGWDLAITLRP